MNANRGPDPKMPKLFLRSDFPILSTIVSRSTDRASVIRSEDEGEAMQQRRLRIEGKLQKGFGPAGSSLRPSREWVESPVLWRHSAQRIGRMKSHATTTGYSAALPSWNTAKPKVWDGSYRTESVASHQSISIVTSAEEGRG